MGAIGTSGGFDTQSYFKTSPYYLPYLPHTQEHGPQPPPYSASPFNQSLSSPFLASTSGSSQKPLLPLIPLRKVSGLSPALSGPLDGERLMALLTTQSGSESYVNDNEILSLLGPDPPSSDEFLSSSAVDVSVPPPAIAPASTAPPVNLAPSSPLNRLHTKPPRGRHLTGERIAYNVDVRNPGEAKPQLEVSPITVHGFDPVLGVGRQIAVNRKYICYGLQAATIRILNINTSLRALLRGHTERVTDMAFFAEDVNLLASASTDGRIIVRNIVQGRVSDGRVLISDQLVLALQFYDDWESCHPLLHWHPHYQDILAVAVGKYVLTIDVRKVKLAAPPGGFNMQNPLVCHIENPLEGINILGAHVEDITDLAIPSGVSTQIASSSHDGKVRVWGEKKLNPSSDFTPHEGESVGAVAFLSAPRHPEQSVLLTAGIHVNRELKLWAPKSDVLPSRSGSTSWECTQTLVFQSSAAEETAFFNKVVVAPRASLILVANAKRNAIYVIHVALGSNPRAAHMDYLAEFTLTMPILSLRVTEETVTDRGEGTVQVYCVQTQAIQQYALHVSQCLPPPTGEVSKEVSSVLEEDSVGLPESGAPSLSGSPKLEKVYTGVVTRVNTAGTGFNNVPTAVIPPRLEHLLEGGHSDILHVTTEMTKLMKTITVGTVAPAKEPKADRGKPLLATTQVIQAVTKNVILPSSVSTGSVRQQYGKLSESVGSMSAVIKGAEPVNRLSSSPSTTSMVEVSLEKEDQERQSGGASASSQRHTSSTPLHLITPSELMSLTALSKAFETDIVPSSGVAEGPINGEKNLEVIRPVPVAESMKTEAVTVVEIKAVQSEAVDAKVEAGARDYSACRQSKLGEKVQAGHSERDLAGPSQSLPSSPFTLHKSYVSEEAKQAKRGGIAEDGEEPYGADDVQEHSRDMVWSGGGSGAEVSTTLTQTSAVVKGRKTKNKTNGSGAGALQSSLQPAPTPAAMMEGETSSKLNMGSLDCRLAAQVASMHDSLKQFIKMQKELQKQLMVMVAVPVAKESKRMEGALGQQVEKVPRAHVDAMWALLAEENAKGEKAEHDRMQKVTTLLTSFVSNEMPTTLDRGLKKEYVALGPTFCQAIVPPLQKAISTAITDAFQKLPQLENMVGAKLESIISQQLQTQSQTTGGQALQVAFKKSFEGSLIPAFERSCQGMFEQVDSAFQRGMAEYTSHAQQQFTLSHSALASMLQDTIASASSLAASLKSELTDSHKKLVVLMENAGKNAACNQLIPNQTNGPLLDKELLLQHLEESLDPTLKLKKLVSEHKLEEAFNKALSLSDVTVVSWLCNQVDPLPLFATSPLPLSQGVLLSLVQQLGCDLGKDTVRKLTWIQEAVLALNPTDPMLVSQMRPFLDQLYQHLHRHMLLLSPGGESTNPMRLVIHVVNSLLTSCK